MELLLNGVSVSRMFSTPPVVDFRPRATRCSRCGCELNVQKTRIRTLSTLHVGRFQAREWFLVCPSCARTHRSEELRGLVPPGANFGYDVMVHAGKAFFLRHRNEEEVVAELAEKNVRISPREASLLGMKFITYLAMAHQRSTPGIMAEMRTRGGYVCHLDATCEGGNPLLMSSIDSLSNIVLGNVKPPAENQAHIVPFLRRIKRTYGTPLALVHDMGKGILSAVAKVFPDVPDFICHFHFLRDIGRDFPGTEYDIIRKRLRAQGISAKLRGAMRIAPKSGGNGLNDEGKKGNIHTIEKRVEKFRAWMTCRDDYPQNPAAQKMIKQIDTYWVKLFADPITVRTPSGDIRIQPQRTNNILEQFFRSLKRANRRRTGNASSRRMLQTILAETPLVRNLENPAYMKILLKGERSLESVFSSIDIEAFRETFRLAQEAPEKVPAKLKPLIAMPDFPEKLVNMLERAVA